MSQLAIKSMNIKLTVSGLEPSRDTVKVKGVLIVSTEWKMKIKLTLHIPHATVHPASQSSQRSYPPSLSAP
jgi:hypothetical protein